MPKLDFKWYIIIVLFILCVYFRQCGGHHTGSDTGTSTVVPAPKPETTKIFIPPPPPVTITKYKDRIVEKIKTVHDTAWQHLSEPDMDSAVKHYYERAGYITVYIDKDSTIKATVYDTVVMNTLEHSSFKYEFLKPREEEVITNTVVQNPIVPKVRNKIFLGANVIEGSSLIVSSQATLLTKDGQMYHLMYGYDLDRSSRMVGFGLSFLISLHK